MTRVPAIAGVEDRARRLGEQIFRAFPDEPVHVIGHSMGGSMRAGCWPTHPGNDES